MILSGRPWKLFLLGGVFVATICSASLWLLAREQERVQSPELARQLMVQAQMARDVVRAQWPALDRGAVPTLLQTLRAARVQVTVADTDGKVLIGAASEAQAARALLTLPEAREALRTGSAMAVRAWGPEGERYMVAAARVGPDEAPLGLVWLARPVWSATEDPSVLARLLVMVGAVAALATLVFVLIVLRLRRGVFRRVMEAARHLSAGELSEVPPLPGDDEFAALASTLHGVRARLASQVELIDGQRRMLSSLVNQLREGVIVARADGRIALTNPSAIRMLNLPVRPDEPEGLVGRPVETCIPQHALQLLLAPGRVQLRADEAEPPAETRLEVRTRQEAVHLLARASDVQLAETGHDVPPAGVGRVVVLTDITELQRTIELRTDFVANASHELRTPLSTICAAVETLLTMDLSAETPAAMQFLEKIARQGRRLQQMVSDLLDLSRLASPAERFEPEELNVGRLLDDLHERFAAAFERKGLHWDAGVEPPDVATIRANPQLLRLVLDNLVDNAVKFTEPGGHVGVYVRVADGQACFEVRDDGCGIPPEDRERVFERFYQVQRSRSGPERGTGLGLSIVRHAVSALRGVVRLESEPGRGTRVLVTIPPVGTGT